MREIKFRGVLEFGVDNKEHVEFFYYTTNNKHQSKTAKKNELCKKYHCISNCRQRHELQYMGIKDKNEKETYEGDIVKINNEILLVKYLDEYCRFDFVDCLSRERVPMFFRYIIDYNDIYQDGEMYEIEIIGNKFENPELLNS